MTPESRHLTRDALETAGTKIAVLVLGLGTGIVTARLLGPHDRGLFSLLAVFPTTLAILVKLGIGPANIYVLRREGAAPGAVVANSIALAFLLGGACMTAVWCLHAQLLKAFLPGARPIHLLVLLPLVPAGILQSYLFAFLQGQGHFRLFNRRLLWQAAGTLVGMLTVLILLGLGLLAALLVTVGVQAATTAWVLWSAFRLVPSGTARPSGTLLKRTLRFGVKSHAQILTAHLHSRIDLYMVAFFLTPSDVAYYAIATRLAEMIFLIPNSLGLAMYPRLAARDPAGAHALTARACRLVFSGAVAAATLLAIGGQWLIPTWYGAAYAPAVKPLRFLVLAVCFMSLYYLLSRNFTSRNRQEVNLLAAGVSLAANVALNLTLIPRLGVTGAALSSSISYGLAATILSIAFLRASRLSLRQMIVPQRAELGEYVALARSAPRLLLREVGR